jgi:hypothetical protein
MTIPTRPQPGPRAIIFWNPADSSFGVADLATETELATGFQDLHAAFQDADARGLRVVLCQATRGNVKHPPRKPEKVA